MNIQGIANKRSTAQHAVIVQQTAKEDPLYQEFSRNCRIFGNTPDSQARAASVLVPTLCWSRASYRSYEDMQKDGISIAGERLKVLILVSLAMNRSMDEALDGETQCADDTILLHTHISLCILTSARY